MIEFPALVCIALNAFGEKMGQEPKACLPLLVEDPGNGDMCVFVCVQEWVSETR